MATAGVSKKYMIAMSKPRRFETAGYWSGCAIMSYMNVLLEKLFRKVSQFLMAG